MRIINKEQLSILEGFKLHTWNVFHNKTPNMFKFWAKELDDKKVPYNLQNKVANWTITRENGFKSLKELLSSEGIEIK